MIKFLLFLVPGLLIPGILSYMINECCLLKVILCYENIVLRKENTIVDFFLSINHDSKTFPKIFYTAFTLNFPSFSPVVCLNRLFF